MNLYKFLLSIMIILFCYSCQSSEKTDGIVSDELISLNLSKGEEVDLKLLVGEWYITMFAYTADGNKISDVKKISNISSISPPYDRLMTINDDPMLYNGDAPTDMLGPWIIGNNFLFYSISGNLLSFLKIQGSPYFINIILTDEGNEVLNALKNAYSFSIKNKELKIYFKGDKNKNLLIFKNSPT